MAQVGYPACLRGPNDSEIVQTMIRHETTNLRWLDMESRGEREGSLDAIIDELR